LKVRLEEALFGELSLEETMDLSRDRLILELERYKLNWLYAADPRVLSYSLPLGTPFSDASLTNRIHLCHSCSREVSFSRHAVANWRTE
jgi:hypothetical protein